MTATPSTMVPISAACRSRSRTRATVASCRSAARTSPSTEARIWPLTSFIRDCNASMRVSDDSALLRARPISPALRSIIRCDCWVALAASSAPAATCSMALRNSSAAAAAWVTPLASSLAAAAMPSAALRRRLPARARRRTSAARRVESVLSGWPDGPWPDGPWSGRSVSPVGRTASSPLSAFREARAVSIRFFLTNAMIRTPCPESPQFSSVALVG